MIINIVIAIVQEERAATALEALRSAAAPTARVLRSGQPMIIPADEVVPGGVALLAAGDRVPADLWLFDGWSLEANESMLTGESLTVAKSPAVEGDMSLPTADRTWLVYAGTLIPSRSGAFGPAIPALAICLSRSAIIRLASRIDKLASQIGEVRS